MEKSGLPDSMQELMEVHGALVRWTIVRTLKREPRDGEVDDLSQMIYLRVVEQNFLARSRAYLATHPGEQFSTGLVTLARNVVLNAIDRRRCDPIECAGGDSPALHMPYTDHNLRGVEAARFLDRVVERCPPKVPARVILQAALVHGTHSGHLSAETGISASTIRHHLVKIRNEARQLRQEEMCPIPDRISRSMHAS